MQIDTDDDETVSLAEFTSWLFQTDPPHLDLTEESPTLHYATALDEPVEVGLGELATLVKIGEVHAGTQVWLEGLADWMTLGEAQRASGAVAEMLVAATGGVIDQR